MKPGSLLYESFLTFISLISTFLFVYGWENPNKQYATSGVVLYFPL